MDTIFALATARGKSGVAVIRVSGPRAHDAAATLTGSGLAGRGMSVRNLYDVHGELLDEAVILTFVGPNSFTGEDVVEFQIHGSSASVQAVSSALAALSDLRQAEPGEFTRRALENGRLDLAQVEGLADLIDSETEAQRKQAQAILSGKLGDLAESWRRDLIRAASLLEAVIDFADEEVPTDVTPEVSQILERLMGALRQEISGVRIAERIRDGFEVAIIGAPNVGKSTLLNALAGRDAAITSDIAGTTRDVIEVRMDLAGLPVTLLDTAGLRDTDDVVESLGIGLARQRAERADLRVFLIDGWDSSLGISRQTGDIVVAPKADLRGTREFAVSGKTGQGIDELITKIENVLVDKSTGAGIATRDRHRKAMTDSLERLLAARNLLDLGPDSYDLSAEEMRSAIRSLESLVGRIGVENLLDEIFASFCLGK
ncbi:tRNA uridine-5-carboxymethylaminomethyl(34) synthesis GTPase MnmE [Lutimaribacter marinistellae]|uniref:tRNA modification GTPase MnmE n=1 Tax=Lutimaribacter marinistellae TaxID=1820329 RepID=A0ABV7TE06_9RHOB